MRRLVPLLLVGTILATSGLAEEISVVAWVEPRSGVTEADYIQLRIRIEGERKPGVTTPDLPDMTNLRVVRGPSTSSSFSFVNGRSSASLTLTYALVAEGTGPAEIPSFVVTVDGTEYRTEPIRFDVAEAPPAPTVAPSMPEPSGESEPRAARDAEVYLRAALGSEEAYVGQLVPLDVTLLSAERIQGWDFIQAPTFSNFWVEDAAVNPDAERYVTTMGGKRYNAFPIVRKYLIPTNDGLFEIGEWVGRTTVVRSSRDPMRNLFGGGRATTIIRRTEPIRLQVRSLPEAGKPEGFAGAVGRYTMETDLDRTEAEVDEAVALRVTVSGEGFLKAIPAPELVGPPDLKIFEPKTEETVSHAGQRLVSTLTWEWVLVPLGAGEVRLPEVRFAYFDPEVGEYRELVEGGLLLTVSRGTGGNGRRAAGGKVRAQRREISFIKPRRGPLQEHTPRAHERGWFLVLLFLPVLVSPALIAAGRWRARLRQDRGFARGRKARKRARSRLDAVEKKGAQTESGPFHEAIARALVEYVADRFDRSGAGLTYDGIDDLLRSRGVDEGLRSRFRACLERCDFARFVPSSGEAGRRAEVLGEARDLVDAVERSS